MESFLKRFPHFLSAPLKVAVAYATFSALWILLSDWAMELVIEDAARLTQASILKGWFFVLVTSVLLYGLVNRLLRRPVPLGGAEVWAHRRGSERWLIYAFALAFTLGAHAVRLTIEVSAAERPFITLYLFPIILAAFLGGLGPGLAALAVACLAIGWSGILPFRPAEVLSIDLLQWSFLVINGLLVSLLSEVFHRAKRQVEANHQLQLITLESIGDAVVTTDTEGRVHFLNGAAERLTGWVCEAAVGRPLDEVLTVIDENSRVRVPQPARNASSTAAAAAPMVLVSKDGKEIPIHASAAPIRLPSGSTLGEVFVFRDDTERRRLVKAQEERLEALNLLDAIADTSSDAIYAKDVEGRYLFFNREASRITGRPAAEILGRDDTVLFSPGEASALRRSDRGVLAGGRANVGEVTLTTVDGPRVFFSSTHPLRDAAGAVIGLFGIARDITERTQAEALIRERLALQERLASIALSVPGVICSYLYRPDGTASMPFSTPAVEDLYGLTQAELAVGMEGWRVNVPPDELARLQGAFLVSMTTLAPWHEVFRYNHPRKGLRWIEGWSIPKREADGSVVWNGYFTDATERKRGEDAFRESEESLERAQAIAHVGSWRLDIPSGVLTWSAESCRIFNVAETEPLTADSFFERVHPDDLERVRSAWERALEGSPYDIEHRIVVDGQIKWVRQQAEIRRDETGSPALAFGTIQEISERKLAETERTRLQAEVLQAQKMESIGRLAGGVAHDFNNMLQVIAGNAELALNHVQVEGPLRNEILLIKKAAERSSDLTRQLLAFARRQTISPKVVDLNDVVANMLKMLGRLVGEDIKLVWSPRTSLWRIRVDPAQIDQVLANLTVNARDAIAAVGTITLATDHHVLTEADCVGILGATPGDYVSLAVQDTGCGIEPEVMEHIFEPFFTTKEAGKGTGLGLATVFGIAQQNGGFVQAFSQPGHGATFRVSFPRWIEDAESEDRPAVQEPVRGRGETILLVEDDEALLFVGEAMLQELGYRVAAAGSPEKALRLVQTSAERIDLFLLDVVMPLMNGRELANQLGRLRPEVPVLFMSGYTADIIAARGTVDEGIHLLTKPFSMLDLSRKVREVLEAPR